MNHPAYTLADLLAIALQLSEADNFRLRVENAMLREALTASEQSHETLTARVIAEAQS